MKDFFIDTKNVRGCINRLTNIGSTLQSLSLSVENMSSTLGSVGLGEMVSRIVWLSNQLSINCKIVNRLSESLSNIVNRYILAEDNITSLSLPQSQTEYISLLSATSHKSPSDIDKVLATIGAALGATLGAHLDDFLFFPKPGSVITVSPGIDKPSYECIVADTNAWSVEYSIADCQNVFGDSLCWKRLNYAIQHYDYNEGCQDLLKFNLDGYDEPVFAGAMIEGYADIGDIVYVTLDNGDGFYFMILDTKSNQHVSTDFPSGQVQYEGGHGYITNSGSVQLSNCEFIMSDGVPGVYSAMNTESGAFLNDTYVVSAEIVDHVDILE